MRAWMTFALTLALASTVPAAAQTGQEGMGSAGPAPTVTQNIAKGVLSEGAFVRHTAAISGQPEMVTIRSTWNGLPVLASFLVRHEDHWQLDGQPIDWSTLQPGTVIAVPTTAGVWHVTFDGSVDVGKVSAIDATNNTFTVALPNGEVHTLGFSPDAIVVRNDHTDTLDHVKIGDTVLFETPPGQQHVALFNDLGQARQATISSVGGNGLTLTFTEAGKQQTRTFSPQQGVLFYSQGRPVLSANLAGAFQPGQPAWILGPTGRPRAILSGVETGYQAALVGTPETVGAAPAVGGTPVAAGAAPCPPCPAAVSVAPRRAVSRVAGFRGRHVVHHRVRHVVRHRVVSHRVRHVVTHRVAGYRSRPVVTHRVAGYRGRHVVTHRVAGYRGRHVVYHRVRHVATHRVAGYRGRRHVARQAPCP